LRSIRLSHRRHLARRPTVAALFPDVLSTSCISYFPRLRSVSLDLFGASPAVLSAGEIPWTNLSPCDSMVFIRYAYSELLDGSARLVWASRGGSDLVTCGRGTVLFEHSVPNSPLRSALPPD